MSDGIEPVSSQAGPPTANRRYRSLIRIVLRRAGWAIAGLCVAAVVLLGAVRLYFSDARVRQIVIEQLGERLPNGVELELRAVELSLLSGLELHGFRIGPLPGFSKDIVSFERVAVHWSFWDLLLFAVVIEEIAVEELYFCLEENEDLGRNVDALIAVLVPPAETEEPEPEPELEPEPEPESDDPFSFAAIDLPMRVEVVALEVRDVTVELLLPDLAISVNRLSAAGRFLGEGTALDLDLQVKLGRPEQPSEIHARLGPTESPQIILDVAQFLDVRLESYGLGDIGLELALDTKAQVTLEEPLPLLHVRGDLSVAADLLTQHATVERCTWTVAEETRLEFRAEVHDFLASPSQQRLALRQLELVSSLDELTPWLSAFVDGGSVTGAVAIRFEPIETDVGSLSAPVDLAQLTSRVVIDLTDVGAELLGIRASGLTGKIEVETNGGDADVTVNLALASASIAGQRLAGLELLLTVKTPLSPWLGGDDVAVQPLLRAELQTKLRYGGSGSGSNDWRVDGADLSIEASAPIALLLRGSAAEPVTVGVRLHVPHAAAAAADIAAIDLRLDARAWDLRGARADALLGLGIREVTLQIAEESLRVPGVRLDADLSARGTSYTIRSFSFTAAEVLALDIHGTATRLPHAVVKIDGLELTLRPFAVETALALLPDSLRPKEEISGRIGLTVSGDGTIPYADLLRQAMPQVAATASSVDLVVAYVGHMEAWAQRFRAGLPFDLHLTLAGENLTYSGASFTATDIGADLSVDIERDGPRVEVTVSAAEIAHQTESARMIDGRFRLSFAADEIRSTIATSVGWYDRPELLRPVEDSTVDLALTYKVGGDFFLETLAVRAPDRGAELVVEGLVIKPVRILMQGGLEKQGLPGVEGELRWRLAFGSERMEPLALGLPSVGGTVGLAGSLSIEDGVVAVRGGLEFDGLSLRYETITPASDAPPAVTLVREVNGAIPFDVRVAFRRHLDATALFVGQLPIGGGRMWLITSPQDIRDRPARPVHYSRLQPYRKRRGLTIDHIETGNIQIDSFELDARLQDGILAVDRVALHILGGDLLGEMALQLDRESEIVAQFSLKSSNIDASYFKTLNLEPGPESELSADFDLSLLFGPSERDLTLRMNITKIGGESFDRLLQALSDNGKDEKIEGYRKQLGFVSINEVAVWMRYENLNIDLDYSTVVPGYRPIPRDMLRRYSTSGFLDVYLQPILDEKIGPPLGW